MADLALAWDNVAGFGDLCIANSDLVGDDELATAVLVSLFTDRRAQIDDLPAGDTERRGWWGDLVADDVDPIGSLLWLLERRKLTNEVIALAERYSQDALEWLVDDGEATRVETPATRAGPERLNLLVRIHLPSGAVREFQFDDVLGRG